MTTSPDLKQKGAPPLPIAHEQGYVTNEAGRTRLRVSPLEAIDGTPIIDIKQVFLPTKHEEGARRPA
jgi:tRNA (Thr-GGU) A37 N-methylase